MVPKKLLKLAKSLQHKKYRYQEQLFLVEGAKSIVELLGSSFTVRTLIGTSVFVNQHRSLIEKHISETSVYLTSESEISSASSFKNNNTGIALVEMPRTKTIPVTFDDYVLVLDNIRDPGNLGTIIRIADWYGVAGIVSSPETTDEYSPKVISASMGSFLRVPFFRANLADFLSKTELPVYGTLVGQGTSVHHTNFAECGLIVLGSESEGMRRILAQYITQAVHIPQFGTAESLNVGIAAAVLCDNVRRKLGEKSDAKM
ncbi:MAG: TrmH family RNA methyltransferase [Cyclobacteriaceae bacterium]|mgnify:CR=1 FL=1